MLKLDTDIAFQTGCRYTTNQTSRLRTIMHLEGILALICFAFLILGLLFSGSKKIGFTFLVLFLLTAVIGMISSSYNDVPPQKNIQKIESQKLTVNAVVAQKLLRGEIVSIENYTDIGNLGASAVHELGLTVEQAQRIFTGSNVTLRLGYIPTNIVMRK